MNLSLVFACALACTMSATAEVHVVVQQGLTYNPAEITVNPGDTIRWEYTGGTHDVVHGQGCFEDQQPIFAAMPLTSSNPVAEWTVPAACYGEVPYFCSVSSHCQQGMVGLIKVVPADGATVHNVQQEGIRFAPETIEAAPGDVVRWTWSAGGHTVSSGEIATCTVDNTFFNLILDQQHAEVLWVVSEDMPDTLEYFCLPHCSFLHIGKIVKISSNPCPADLNGDNMVDGADLTLLLSAWGQKGSSADLNGDTTVDGADLTVLLSNWGSC